MQTNEYDCWLAGELELDEHFCLDCGEVSETSTCGACQEAYELEQARRCQAAVAWYAEEEQAQAKGWDET